VEFGPPGLEREQDFSKAGMFSSLSLSTELLRFEAFLFQFAVLILNGTQTPEAFEC